MSKYKVISPISIGERQEIGTILNLDKETAARYSTELEKVADTKKFKLTKKFLEENPELAAQYEAQGFKAGDTVEVEEAPEE